MLQPVVRRTWALCGQTPIHYSWARHERLSVISALTISPVLKHFGLYFRIYHKNICFGQVMEFLTFIHYALGRKFVVVLDRYSAHRKAVRLLLEKHPGWFEAEWLPAYAPELNPTEYVWGHTKYGDLANYIPKDIEKLKKEVAKSLKGKHSRQSLLGSFVEHTGLDL